MRRIRQNLRKTSSNVRPLQTSSSCFPLTIIDQNWTLTTLTSTIGHSPYFYEPNSNDIIRDGSVINWPLVDPNENILISGGTSSPFNIRATDVYQGGTYTVSTGTGSVLLSQSPNSSFNLVDEQISYNTSVPNIEGTFPVTNPYPIYAVMVDANNNQISDINSYTSNGQDTNFSCIQNLILLSDVNNFESFISVTDTNMPPCLYLIGVAFSLSLQALETLNAYQDPVIVFTGFPTAPLRFKSIHFTESNNGYKFGPWYATFPAGPVNIGFYFIDLTTNQQISTIYTVNFSNRC